MPDDRKPAEIAWKALQITGRAAKWVGRKASEAYEAIDPDVRMQLGDLPLAATTMLGARTEPVSAMLDDGHRPVVCIHGMSGHRQNFFPLRAWLRLHERTRVYSFGYDDAEPLDYAVAALVRTVDEIVRVNALDDDAKVDVVAHSMGGLVTRLALLDPSFRDRVATVVTLGTPHQGTLAARYLATPRALDLRPGSAIFEKLAVQLPWAPPLPRLVALHSTADILMLPPSTATLPGADNRELPKMSHSGYLTRPKALAAIERALRG